MIATPKVTPNTITLFGSTTSSNNPAVLAALLESSKPIKATTGPIAAGGSTTSIHFVPNFLIKAANKHPQKPTTTKPPRAYSYPNCAITIFAGAIKAKLLPK